MGRNHRNALESVHQSECFVFSFNSKIHEVSLHQLLTICTVESKDRGDDDKQELGRKNRKDIAWGRRADWKRGDIPVQWWVEEFCWSNDFLWKKRRWALTLSCPISTLSYYAIQSHKLLSFYFSSMSVRHPVLANDSTIMVPLTHPSCLICNEKLYSLTSFSFSPYNAKNGPHKYKSEFSWVSPIPEEISASPWNNFLE